MGASAINESEPVNGENGQRVMQGNVVWLRIGHGYVSVDSGCMVHS